MNHRVKLSEVTRFADELHNETMKILDGLDDIRSNINQIIQMDTFQGETADNSKAYFSEVHGAILQAFEDLFTSLQHTIDNHIESFQANVDSNDSAIIESYYLEEQITKIEDDYNELSQISQDINRIIQSVSDISSATAPSLTDVTNHLDDVIEVPVKLKKKLSNFTNSGKNDIANINTNISEIESLIGKIEAKRGISKNNEWFETGLNWVHTNGFLLQRRAKTVGQAGTLSSSKNLTNFSNFALNHTSSHGMLGKELENDFNKIPIEKMSTYSFSVEEKQSIADYLKALEKGEALSNIDRYKGMDDYVYEGHVGKHNIFGQPVGGNAPQNGETISTILDFMPIIGNVKAIGEAYYGHNPLARRDLEEWERWVAAAGVIGGGIGKLGAKAVPKVADNLGDIVKGTSEAKTFGKYSTNIDDKVKVIEKVDLPNWISESYTDGIYRTVSTKENITFFRTYGGGSKINGSFVTTSPAGNRINAKINTALVPDWKNTRQYEAVIEVPKGQVLNIGRVEKQYTKTGAVLKGDGDQILLPQGWPSEWIKEIKEVPSR